MNTTQQNNNKIFNRSLIKNNYIPEPSTVIVRDNLPMTKQWTNGVYNFNNNLIKNVPSADATVNRIIKNFFTINPLSNNPNGKKSKLLKRRYKRLSLNKILVSKPEVKHDNNKVFITVYLFNKKKISLLKSIASKLNDLSTGKTGMPMPSIKPFTVLAKLYNEKQENKANSKISNANAISTKRKLVGLAFKALKSRMYKTLTVSKILNSRSTVNKLNNKRFAYKSHPYRYKLMSQSRIKRNKYNYPKLGFKLTAKNKYISYKNINSLTKKRICKFLNNSIIKKTNERFVNNMLKSYYDISNKYRLLDSINSTKILPKIYFKYKSVNKLPNVVNNFFKKDRLNGPFTRKIYKLRSVYTLFSSFNNFNYMEGYKNNKIYAINDLKQGNILFKYSSNLSKNSYKLIKFVLNNKNAKLNKGNSKIKRNRPINRLFKQTNPLLANIKNNKPNKTQDFASISIDNGLIRKVKSSSKLYKSKGDTLRKAPYNKNSIVQYIPSISPKVNRIKPSNKFSKLPYRLPSRKPSFNNIKILNNNRSKLKLLKKRISYQYKVRKTNNIALINKINRIDRFFKKYNKVILSNKNNNNNQTTLTLNNIVGSKLTLQAINNLSLAFKSRYIKDILHKEITYLNYVKLLSYDNNLFKSWFLTPLRDILSRIYNKKVILNLVNLKYIHLNSDILLQAIAMRLRNIKKNRLNKVLIKALALVKISRINSYTRDIHNPIYNYVEQHFNNFRHLNKLIFNEVESKNLQKDFVNSDNNVTAVNVPSNVSHIPVNTKWLNNIQTSTINFIKYKTVFGIKLEASGRLTKRSTASRAVFKFRYKGGLKNNPVISRNSSPTIIKSNRISNLQYAKISSKTRNGSFGLKSWINNN